MQALEEARQRAKTSCVRVDASQPNTPLSAMSPAEEEPEHPGATAGYLGLVRTIACHLTNTDVPSGAGQECAASSPCGDHWDCIGIMKKKMEATILHRGCIGIMEKNMETTSVIMHQL